MMEKKFEATMGTLEVHYPHTGESNGRAHGK